MSIPLFAKKSGTNIFDIVNPQQTFDKMKQVKKSLETQIISLKQNLSTVQNTLDTLKLSPKDQLRLLDQQLSDINQKMIAEITNLQPIGSIRRRHQDVFINKYQAQIAELETEISILQKKIESGILRKDQLKKSEELTELHRNSVEQLQTVQKEKDVTEQQIKELEEHIKVLVKKDLEKSKQKKLELLKTLQEKNDALYTKWWNMLSSEEKRTYNSSIEEFKNRNISRIPPEIIRRTSLSFSPKSSEYFTPRGDYLSSDEEEYFTPTGEFSPLASVIDEQIDEHEKLTSQINLLITEDTHRTKEQSNLMGGKLSRRINRSNVQKKRKLSKKKKF